MKEDFVKQFNDEIAEEINQLRRTNHIFEKWKFRQ